MPAHARNSSEQRSSSRRGTRPDQLDRRDVGALAAGERRAPRGTRPRCRCGRGRRGSSRPAGARPTRASGRARARRAARRRARGPRGRCGGRPRRRASTSSRLIATSGLRAPTAVAPSVGCGAAGPEVGRARSGTRARRDAREVAADRVGVVVEEHRARRSVSAHHRAELARGVGGRARVGRRCRRARRTARRRARRERVHAVVVDDRDVARRPRRRARACRGRASCGPGPASVNTERWWSASACTSTSDAPHASATARSAARSRPSETFTTHSSTRQAYGRRGRRATLG